MGSTYSIIMLDKDTGKQIGELPTASPAEIMSLIGKGFKIIDRSTSEELTMESVQDKVGVSDGVILG